MKKSLLVFRSHQYNEQTERQAAFQESPTTYEIRPSGTDFSIIQPLDLFTLMMMVIIIIRELLGNGFLSGAVPF
jgi:hypothetical protein